VLRTDQRFKAGINMDGTVFAMSGQTPVEQPFLWMASDYSHITDAQLAQISMSRSEFEAKVQKRNEQREAFLRRVKRGHRVVLKGSTHSTYITDEAALSALIPGMQDKLATIDPNRATSIINAYVVFFFDHNLKTTASTAAWPLFPDVELTDYTPK
jgi:hypothetical protein